MKKAFKNRSFASGHNMLGAESQTGARRANFRETARKSAVLINESIAKLEYVVHCQSPER